MFDRFLNHGQRLQSEEVHLEQADGLHRLHFKLGDHLFVFIPRERQDVDQRLFADHHTGGVGAGMPRQPFKDQRILHDLLRHRILFGCAFEIWIFFQRFGQRCAGRFRHHLSQLVALVQRQSQHAADIADNGFCAERSEGDDLRDVFASVFVFDVLDHFAAAGLTEIDIKVRRRHAVGIEEAFKNQVVMQRIERRDTQRVGQHTACAGTAARADRNVLTFCVGDEILHDEEIVDEPGFLNNPDFIIEAFSHLFFDVRLRLVEVFNRIKLLQSGNTDRHQIILLAFIFRRNSKHRKMQRRIFENKLHVTAAGDFDGVGQRLRMVREQPLHFRAALHIKLIAGIAHPVRVAHQITVLEADQYIMRIAVFLLDVMHIVGRHQRQTGALGHFDNMLISRSLLGNAVILNFEEKIARPEDFGIFLRQRHRFINRSLGAGFRDLAFQTGRQTDQPLAVLPENLLIDARLIMEALQMADGNQMHQIIVALVILRQQNQMQIIGLSAVAMIHPFAGDVHFATDDRLNACFLSLLIKIDHAVQHAVIGNRQMLLPQLLGHLNGIRHLARTIEQAVFRVKMKMAERYRFHRSGCPYYPSRPPGKDRSFPRSSNCAASFPNHREINRFGSGKLWIIWFLL